MIPRIDLPVFATAAAANAFLAQIDIDVAGFEKWIILVSKIGSTTILAVACYVLWKQLRREQEDNVRLRSDHVQSLQGLITECSKALQRVAIALDRQENRHGRDP